MRSFVFTLLLASLLLLTSSCDEAKSQRCKDMCQQATDCAEQQNRNGESLPYDLDECIAACVGLERDTTGKKLVDEHWKCAQKAGDNCEELSNCQQVGD